MSVIGDLVWKSFEDRFGDILERIRSYRELIKLEISLAHAKILNSSSKIAEKEHRLAEEERRQAAMTRENANQAAENIAEVRELINRQSKGNFARVYFMNAVTLTTSFRRSARQPH